MLPTNLVAGCMGQEDDGAELKDARVAGDKDTHSWEVRSPLLRAIVAHHMTLLQT